jgi:hypothetical protein
MMAWPGNGDSDSEPWLGTAQPGTVGNRGGVPVTHATGSDSPADSQSASWTLSYMMISYMMSYNHDITHDIVVLTHYDIIVLWYHRTMIHVFCYMILSCMISRLYDIISFWYHTSYHKNSLLISSIMISCMIPYFWIYDIKIIWYHSSMIS